MKGRPVRLLNATVLKEPGRKIQSFRAGNWYWPMPVIVILWASRWWSHEVRMCARLNRASLRSVDEKDRRFPLLHKMLACYVLVFTTLSKSQATVRQVAGVLSAPTADSSV
jgi:hypothetical protein